MFATSLAYLAAVTLRIPPAQTGGFLETEGGREGLRHRGEDKEEADPQERGRTL